LYFYSLPFIKDEDAAIGLQIFISHLFELLFISGMVTYGIAFCYDLLLNVSDPFNISLRKSLRIARVSTIMMFLLMIVYMVFYIYFNKNLYLMEQYYYFKVIAMILWYEIYYRALFIFTDIIEMFVNLKASKTVIGEIFFREGINKEVRNSIFKKQMFFIIYRLLQIIFRMIYYPNFLFYYMKICNIEKTFE
jgi:hypothetical protein